MTFMPDASLSRKCESKLVTSLAIEEVTSKYVEYFAKRSFLKAIDMYESFVVDHREFSLEYYLLTLQALSL